MKRKILVLFVLLSLVLSLAAGAAAAVVYDVTISDDLQRVTVGNESYVRANTSDLAGYDSAVEARPALTEAQQEQYKQVKLYFLNGENYVIRVDLHMTDGTVMQLSYVREDLYQDFMNTVEQEEYTVTFRYPVNNDAVTEKSLLCGEETTLYIDVLRSVRNFEVLSVGTHRFSILKGWLLVADDAYYYVDREENNLTVEEVFSDLPKVKAWKVTDADLCARFDKALDRYYEDLGILEDPEVTDRVSAVFMIIMFGFLPFAVLAAFTVFAIVTKKREYRILYIVVSTCALLVLAAVIVTFLIV